MVIDMILGFGLISVIGIQALMIQVYQKRFNKINRHLLSLVERKSDKSHKHNMFHGDMDVHHRGKTARVEATFYPKKAF